MAWLVTTTDSLLLGPVMVGKAFNAACTSAAVAVAGSRPVVAVAVAEKSSGLSPNVSNVSVSKPAAIVTPGGGGVMPLIGTPKSNSIAVSICAGVTFPKSGLVVRPLKLIVNVEV